MINPINNNTPSAPIEPQQPTRPQAQPSSEPQDTVQLSPAAQKKAGDVDHDGDSH
jgi:hypothetical protein